jgi:hypothetical protein
VKPELVVAVLTFLSAAAVVVTRVRLSPVRGVGQAHVGKATGNAHTAYGVLTLALWVPFLATAHDSSPVGVLGLFCYWLTAVVGLLLLWGWKPSRGRHASSTAADGWSQGSGLALLTHLGMVVSVLVFTWYYGTQS